MIDPEKAALHAYRARMQHELVAMANTLNALATDCAEQIDRNTPALHYYAGAHNAYMCASRTAERVLLLAEEAAGEAQKPAQEGEVPK